MNTGIGSETDTEGPPEPTLFPESPSEFSTKSGEVMEQIPIVESPFGQPFSSPSSFTSLQKSDFVPGTFLDSENSSHSSLDTQPLELAKSARHFRESRSRERGSDYSSSDESDFTAAASIDSDDPPLPNRKVTRPSQDSVGLLRPVDAPRGRVANIRRESTCSVDSEISHERLVKATQRVSSGWDEFCIDESDRKSDVSSNGVGRRHSSVSEPISIMTNAFLPHSCSPSPTRIENHKQCFSPSTHQIVRANIPYSPSPSPTRSPTRHQRIMRLRSQSPSPIAGLPRVAMKRRITEMSGIEGAEPMKRACTTPSRTATSPLVFDKQFPFPLSVDFTQPQGPSMMFLHPRRPELLRRVSVDGIPEDPKESNEPIIEPASIVVGIDPSVDANGDLYGRPSSNESAQTDVQTGSLSITSGLDTNPPTPQSSVSGGPGEPPSSVDLDMNFGEDRLNNGQEMASEGDAMQVEEASPECAP